MLDKIPAIMIDPAVVIDVRCDPAGLKVVFSDGTSKVLTCVGRGGGPTPAATITVNGGQTANVTPSSNLSVRVQGVATGTSIQWVGTGTSVSDPLIDSLTSLAGSASSADFTVNVPVGTAQRVITFTASVGGTQVAAFTVTVAATATATDFQISAPASLNFAFGSTTAQQASISLTNLVGDPGAVSVTVTAVPKSIPVYVLASVAAPLPPGTGWNVGDLANVYFTGSNAAVAPGYSQRVIRVTAVRYPGGPLADTAVHNAGGYYSTDGAAINLSSGYMQSAGGGYTTFSGGVASQIGSFSSGFTVSPANFILSSSTTSGTFTVTPAAGMPAGTYSVTVTATNGTTTRTATISLTVAAP